MKFRLLLFALDLYYLCGKKPDSLGLPVLRLSAR